MMISYVFNTNWLIYNPSAHLIRKFLRSLLFFTAFSSFNLNAALVERLEGLAYYDTETNLTWLADANYAMTSGFASYVYGYDTYGAMGLEVANIWAEGLEIYGAVDWRLPQISLPDSTCSVPDISMGYDCSESELAYMRNVILESNITSYTNSSFDLFSNIATAIYWYSNEYNEEQAYIISMHSGLQYSGGKGGKVYAWAVHDGDVGMGDISLGINQADIELAQIYILATPIPASFWLFVSGFIGLMRLAIRKKGQSPLIIYN